MKKLFLLLMIAVIFSCNKDDDDDVNNTEPTTVSYTAKFDVTTATIWNSTRLILIGTNKNVIKDTIINNHHTGLKSYSNVFNKDYMNFKAVFLCSLNTGVFYCDYTLTKNLSDGSSVIVESASEGSNFPYTFFTNYEAYYKGNRYDFYTFSRNLDF